ncbi:hypothetical protein FIBSPDRAFT_954414 [Athelia psychrophila]|uniref:Uncharacterized protein n=1 Tax=Athelia psychrophila TaxID=1759441 RepID=A0A166JCV0_9AGAM|nr:hypothetical protein FIBSPDRAFT_954414 [Fibularhizoctonia sp. CBS 109695]
MSSRNYNASPIPIRDNKDKVQMYLAFGASQFEACKLIATEALRLALAPTINQMSVLGTTAIPDVATGTILGGASTTSIALASIITTVLALSVVADGEHRVRSDRVDGRPHAVYHGRAWVCGEGAERDGVGGGGGE